MACTSDAINSAWTTAMSSMYPWKYSPDPELPTLDVNVPDGIEKDEVVDESSTELKYNMIRCGELAWSYVEHI